MRAVEVEAVEVRRGIDPGRLKRAGNAVDHHLVRDGLGEIAHGNAFRAGKRADDEVDLVLLDKLASHTDRCVGFGIRRSDDGFNLLAGNGVVHLFESQFDISDTILATGREGAFQRHQNADLDGAALGESCAGQHKGGHRDGAKQRLAHCCSSL